MKFRLLKTTILITSLLLGLAYNTDNRALAAGPPTPSVGTSAAQSVEAADLSWNLTEDGLYVIQVLKKDGYYQAFLKNSRGTWKSTNARFIDSLKKGLVVTIDGKTLIPNVVEGFPVAKKTTSTSSNAEITLFRQKLVQLNRDATGKIEPQAEHPLTIYDIRQFGTNESFSKQFVPVPRSNPATSVAFETDLHTHLAGHLPINSLMGIGYRHNIKYPVAMLDRLGVKYPAQAVVDGNIPFQSLWDSVEFKNSHGKTLLEDAMTIERSHIRTFIDMEAKYYFRGPITKNTDAFRDILWAAARASQKSGIKYMEQSVSTILDPALLKMAEKELPSIERKTGVKMRFLIGLWRHSDAEWNLDEITRTKRMVRASPYIIGVDFMGHETNSSQDIASQIKAAAELKKEFGSEFQVRVHAGENALTPSNVRVASELGATRIGHGIYIEKDAAALKLDPHTQKLDPKILAHLKKTETYIELNPASNQALNNLSGGSDVVLAQFKQFKEAGVPVVFGTDGVGMYGADHREIERMLTQLGFRKDDLDYVRRSERRYFESADRAFGRRSQGIKDAGNNIPTKAELEAFVLQEGQHYTPALAQTRIREQRQRINDMTHDFTTKGIQSYDAVFSQFEGMKAIDVSGGSMSQFAALEKEGRLAELRIPEIQTNFKELLVKLDPKKVFFLTGGTQFGVEKILHEEVAKFNALHPNTPFKIVGVLPEAANAVDVFGPAQSGISYYKIAGKGWADFSAHKLELLEKYGGAKVGIAGKMFVADEFRSIINANPASVKVLYMDGPVGASSDLAREIPGGAFKTADEFVAKLVGDKPSEYLTAENAQVNHPPVRVYGPGCLGKIIPGL